MWFLMQAAKKGILNFDTMFAAYFDNPLNKTKDGCGVPELNTKISSPP